MKLICIVASHDNWSGEPAIRHAWSMEKAHEIVLELYNEDFPVDSTQCYDTFENLMFGESGHIHIDFHELDMSNDEFCVSLPHFTSPLHRTEYMVVFTISGNLMWPVIHKQPLHEIIKADTSRDVYRLHMYDKKAGDNSPIGDDQ